MRHNKPAQLQPKSNLQEALLVSRAAGVTEEEIEDYMQHLLPVQQEMLERFLDKLDSSAWACWSHKLLLLSMLSRYLSPEYDAHGEEELGHPQDVLLASLIPDLVQELAASICTCRRLDELPESEAHQTMYWGLEMEGLSASRILDGLGPSLSPPQEGGPTGEHK